MTDGVVAPASVDVPMIQWRPPPWFGTWPATVPGSGIVRRTMAVVPVQSKTVSRVLPTMFWNPTSMRISTYCTLGLPVIPAMISLMCARW